MKSRKIRFIAAVSCLAILISAFAVLPSYANEESDAEKKWSFEITPYAFLAGLNGTLGVNGNNADVDASFDDLKEYIDQAFMGVVEVRRGRLFMAFDALYINLGNEATRSVTGTNGAVTVSGDVDFSTTEQIYQPTIGLRVHDKGKVKVDAIAGARYTNLKNELDLKITTNLAQFPGRGRNISETVEWWDAIVGARIILPFAGKWAVVGYGDIGGGDSDITYQGLGVLKWQFLKNVSASAGYRYLYQDFEGDGLKWDIATSGIIAGVGINF